MKRVKMSRSVWLACVILVTVGVNAQAEMPSRAAMLAYSCTTCHGTNGKGAGKIPKLKGLDAIDIKESMYGFRSGEEKSTIMDHYAKGYTDEEIKLMANYFAAME